MEHDIAVIGGGMSGLMASIFLSEKGLNVAVVSKGDPICSVSSGCIDIAGIRPDTKAAIESLPREHPYKAVGQQGISSSLQYFKEMMNNYGYEYKGSIDKNRSILTPIGKNRITSLVPFTMEHADISKNEEFHLISFKDIKDFFPGYLTGRFPDTRVSIFDAGSNTTLGIATKMDNEDYLTDFISWINGRNISSDKIGVPAILGITKTSEIFYRLEKETGKKFFEIPTLPPSIPGLRLFRKLKNIAESKGVNYYGSAEISEFRTDGKRISGLTIKKPGRPDIIEANAFILATGSFVSGGLFSDRNNLRETVFDLPVFSPKHPLKTDELFNLDFFKLGHPIEKSGIRVNKHFIPEDAEYENLFAAGSILANSEVMKYGCGHGMAIATGITAAKNVWEYLK